MSNMVVRTNVLALNSHRNLGNVGNAQARSSARLSSGFRINNAADDAAGLAISETMRSQIRGLNQASRNAQDGISMIQTAEGGLQTIGDMVARIRELVVQAANDTNTDPGIDSVEDDQTDRAMIQAEIEQLLDEIKDTADRVQFNRRTLLNDDTGTVFFQIGANADQGIDVVMPDVVSVVHSILDDLLALPSGADTGGVNITGGREIGNMLSSIDSVMGTVNRARADLGAAQNRLEFTIENLNISSENLSAANSRIRDADMAREMMSLTQANVLQQAATAMLAQANQAPQSILQLLG